MYAVALYKKDRRSKTGERLEHRVYGLGSKGVLRSSIELNYQQQYPGPLYRVEVREQAEETL